MFLLDVNVLLAAVQPVHAHYSIADNWLASNIRFATCGMTQIGLFRLLLNSQAMYGSPLAPAAAHEVIQDLVSDSRHTFIPSPALSDEFVGQTLGYKAAFDDYLVQVAAAASCKLATFDQALIRRWPDRAFLIQ